MAIPISQDITDFDSQAVKSAEEKAEKAEKALTVLWNELRMPTRAIG